MRVYTPTALPNDGEPIPVLCAFESFASASPLAARRPVSPCSCMPPVFQAKTLMPGRALALALALALARLFYRKLVALGIAGLWMPLSAVVLPNPES